MSQVPERGLVVGSRYRLESILGEGGMAVVWRAVHTETDRPVALKLVRRELVKDEQVREMFVREARVGARIGPNPHIVDFLDAGVDKALEVPFLAMELLDGESLDNRIQREGPVPAALTADVLEQVADGLDQAHTAGVFHRDLKPQNLFLARDKKQRVRVKVLDFGIAKLAESVAQSTTHVGTPAYSAPEQLGPAWRKIAEQGGKKIATQISGGTDVWALGLVIYEMLTGTDSGSLWGALTLAELPVKIVMEARPIASQRAGERAALLPVGFDDWISRCIELDSAARFATAGAAADALLPALRAMKGASAGQAAVSTPPPSPASPPAVTPAPALVYPGSGQHAALAVRHAHGATPQPGYAQGAAPVQPRAGSYAPMHPAPQGQPPHAVAAPQIAAHAPPQQAPYFTGPPQAQHPPAQSPPSMGHHPQGQGWNGAPNAGWTPAPDPRLVAWAAHHHAELRQADPRFYLAWNPFQFLPRLQHVTREARLVRQDAQICVAEAFADDAIRKAAGEDRILLAVVSSPRIIYRAAVRSKRANTVADNLGQFFDGLGSNVPTLGDVAFERHFDLRFPTHQEGNMALPFALRQRLVNAQFRGVLELRPGAFALTRFDATRFDPVDLDKLLEATIGVYSIFSG